MQICVNVQKLLFDLRNVQKCLFDLVNVQKLLFDLLGILVWKTEKKKGVFHYDDKNNNKSFKKNVYI